MIANWFVENSAWFARFEQAELYLYNYLLAGIVPTSNTGETDREVGKSELEGSISELSERKYIDLE